MSTIDEALKAVNFDARFKEAVSRLTALGRKHGVYASFVYPAVHQFQDRKESAAMVVSIARRSTGYDETNPVHVLIDKTDASSASIETKVEFLGNIDKVVTDYERHVDFVVKKVNQLLGEKKPCSGS